MKSRGLAIVSLAGCIAVMLFSTSSGVTYTIAHGSGTVVNTREYTPASSIEQFVSNNLSDMDGLGSLGTHSNFANQQTGPDATYDTLTEENTEP
ncbi:MAG: hypothetical protein ACXAB6_05625, partial [Candidatus Thorarchaeota archaeon]